MIPNKIYVGDKGPVLIVVSGIAKQEKQTRRRDQFISDVLPVLM